jgi:8-oxo-dGTP diphosphatase
MRQRRSIGVYGIVRDAAGRILLVRSGGTWRLPGGEVAHAEDPTRALARTFAAETGLTVYMAHLTDVLLDFDMTEFLTHHDRVIFTVEVRGAGPGTGSWYAPDELAALPMPAWVRPAVGLPVDVPGPVPSAEPDTGPVTRVQRFAAYGLVRDPANRILLTRIAAGYPGAGTWHLPGGGTDFGESAADGLIRELAEETGQRGDVGELLAIEHFHNPAAYGPEKRPIDWHTVRTIFRVTVSHPTEPVVHERGGSTDQARWLSIEQARRLQLNKLARSAIDRYVW